MLTETQKLQGLSASVETRLANTPRRCFSIGGVSLALAADEDVALRSSAELREFEIEPQPCDIELIIEWHEHLLLLQEQPLFDSGSLWKLYSAAPGFICDFVTPSLGQQPYKRLSIDRSFSRGRLLLNREYFRELKETPTLEYPLDELLITNWLTAHRGVELHGCGVLDGAESLLFLGHSGAGKSTTARLWRSQRDAHVLSDDRIIVRRESDEWLMYGTPWHGEAGFASPRKARIDRIFILEHGKDNVITSLTRSRAVAALFARCFPPFHSSAPIEAIVSYLRDLAQVVPCFSFHFQPDSTAVSAILSFDNRHHG
jgi:hypothetical protein